MINENDFHEIAAISMKINKCEIEIMIREVIINTIKSDFDINTLEYQITDLKEEMLKLQELYNKKALMLGQNQINIET